MMNDVDLALTICTASRWLDGVGLDKEEADYVKKALREGAARLLELSRNEGEIEPMREALFKMKRDLEESWDSVKMENFFSKIDKQLEVWTSDQRFTQPLRSSSRFLRTSGHCTWPSPRTTAQTQTPLQTSATGQSSLASVHGEGAWSGCATRFNGSGPTARRARWCMSL